MQPAYTIIIVNYKTPQLLADCLTTVFAQPTTIPFEVIVADNASGDNSRHLITTAFPAVQWVQLDYNAGFARANNEGIRQSKGHTVLLLNSDTLVSDNAIENSYQALQTSAYMACGVQLLNVDGSPQISGAYFVKGGLNYLLPLPYIGPLVKWLGARANTRKPSVMETRSTTEVDWINGAYLMVKKQAIEKAGLMDEDFFLFSEEAEWCSRLGRVGGLCIFGQYHIVHLQGETSNETFGSSGKGYYNLYDRKGLQIMVSNMLRIRKQYGIGWFLLLLSAYTTAVPVYFVASFIEGIFRLRNPFSEWPWAAKLGRNIGRVWALAPAMIANRPRFYKML